jgi:glutamate N-acetyltransferase/amino-acid N-acetyltransferase
MKLPLGFRSGAVAAGLKSSGALDLTVIVNEGPTATAAAVFTTNKIVAAPVTWTRQVIKGGVVRAVVLNSGGANACTGPQGFADTHKSAELVADALSLSSSEVAVCSTGLIGEFLPMGKIGEGISQSVASLTSAGLELSARAIMTTDSVPKIETVEVKGTQTSGIAKGAGMLAPAMATMLSVVMTDAIIDVDSAQELLRIAVDRTFNRIDSDGCTSTNDTVLLMASGQSGVTLSESEFGAVLTKVCQSLSSQLIADAEGHSKLVSIQTINAASESDAVAIGRACARNNLLKCAIFGGDPNWGRILAAAGSAEAQYDPSNVDVTLNGIKVAIASAPGEDRTLVDFSAKEVSIIIDLHAGPHEATILTNDLTHDYVHENSAYAT